MGKKAFTLIELLVVLAIIGILMSFTFIYLNSSRASARDAIRMSGINNYKLLAMSCYNDTSSYFGCQAQNICDYTANTYRYISTLGKSVGQFQSLILTGCPSLTQSQLPNDPINSGQLAYFHYYFKSNAGGIVNPACVGKYVLMTNLENTKNPSSVICATDPANVQNASPNSYWIILGPQ